MANPSITLFKAGSTTLTATQGTITGSVSFNVATGTFGALTVANPGPQTAGNQFTVTLTGTDAYGNPFTGTVSPTFSGPANSPNGTAPNYPATVTFTNGTAAPLVTLYDAQTTTLKVTSGGVSGTSTNFTVAAGPFAGFTMSNPTPTAGTAFNETITAGDTWGNGGTGFTGTQCIAFSGPANAPNGNAPIYPAAGGSCTTGSAVTFNAAGVGTASITLFNAGSTCSRQPRLPTRPLLAPPRSRSPAPQRRPSRFPPRRPPRPQAPPSPWASAQPTPMGTPSGER